MINVTSGLTSQSTPKLRSFVFNKHVVRGAIINGETEIIIQDLCEGLDLDYREAVRRVPDWAKGGGLKAHTLGGEQTLATVKEPGVYYLIFRSDKPEAKEFQRWVCDVLLPTIRKTGRFDAGYQISTSGSERVAQLRALAQVESRLTRDHDLRDAILRGELGTGGLAAVVVEGAVPIQPHLVALLPRLDTPRIRALVQLVVGRCGRAGLPVGRERTTSATGGQTNWQRTARPADILAVLPPADLAAGQKGGA